MAAGKKTGGRAKGTPNKLTAAVKSALSQAFDGVGGVARLVEWGKDNPGEFFKLWVKLLPTEVTGEDGKPITLRIVETVVDDGGGDEAS